jgi:hypothetical protein
VRRIANLRGAATVDSRRRDGVPRQAFATMNAEKPTPDALQALMRHKKNQTTQVYIN